MKPWKLPVVSLNSNNFPLTVTCIVYHNIQRRDGGTALLGAGTKEDPLIPAASISLDGIANYVDVHPSLPSGS